MRLGSSVEQIKINQPLVQVLCLSQINFCSVLFKMQKIFPEIVVRFTNLEGNISCILDKRKIIFIHVRIIFI